MLPVVEGKLGYIAAVAVGAVVTAVCVNVLKSLARKNGSSTEEKEMCIRDRCDSGDSAGVELMVVCIEKLACQYCQLKHTGRSRLRRTLFLVAAR